jgi:PAS domain S-box-containing protein
VPADLSLLKHLADSMPGLVSYIDAGLRYRYMNRAYFDWFGLDPEAGLGMTPREVATEEGFAAFAPHLRRALSGERLVYEETIDFRVGGPRAVRGYLVPDRGADGVVHGVFSFTADVTRQRETEEALRRAHREAMEAVRAKSQFLAAASHDLRQPLHAMALFIGALARRVKDPEGIEIVESLRVAVDSMRAMFQALVDVSKLDAGAVVSAPKAFAVADVLARLRADFAAQAEAKGLRLRVMPCAAAVNTDPLLLESMLRNLVQNAVKFTASGKILVGCRRRGGTLRIDVIDTAGGIAADQLAGIFDEFRRLQPGRKTGTEGLGLGLAIVRRLARLLDLPVTVESAVGRGSRFSITVPLAATLAAAAPAAPEAKHPASGPSLHGARILAIDDDEMVRGAVARILSDWGCTVATAASPAEALARIDLDGFRPDILLVDYNLGTPMDGLALVETIAKHLPAPAPAILVTGATDADAILRFESSGHAWLAKPVDSAQLRRTAALLLEKARRERKPA